MGQWVKKKSVELSHVDMNTVYITMLHFNAKHSMEKLCQKVQFLYGT